MRRLPLWIRCGGGSHGTDVEHADDEADVMTPLM